MAECKFLGQDGQNIGPGTHVVQGIEGTNPPRDLHATFDHPSVPTPSGTTQCIARDVASQQYPSTPTSGGAILANCSGCGLHVSARNSPRTP